MTIFIIFNIHIKCSVLSLLCQTQFFHSFQNKSAAPKKSQISETSAHVNLFSPQTLESKNNSIYCSLYPVSKNQEHNKTKSYGRKDLSS